MSTPDPSLQRVRESTDVNAYVTSSRKTVSQGETASPHGRGARSYAVCVCGARAPEMGHFDLSQAAWLRWLDTSARVTT